MSPRLRTGCWTLAFGLVALTVAACQSEPGIAHRTTPGLSADEVARLPQAPPPTPEAKRDTPPPFGARPSSIGLKRPTLPGQKPAGTEADQSAAKPEQGTKPEDKPERKLDEELKAALGQPTDCLDLQKIVDGGGKLVVRVGAYVGPSGRITRASVSAPGQPSSTLACIERRAVAIKMRDPIEDAPRLVQTELSFEVARAQAPAPIPAPQPPSPPTY